MLDVLKQPGEDSTSLEHLQNLGRLSYVSQSGNSHEDWS